jgi:hypothetical protein
LEFKLMESGCWIAAGPDEFAVSAMRSLTQPAIPAGSVTPAAPYGVLDTPVGDQGNLPGGA